MPYTVGSASLSIVPSFSGVADVLDAEAAKWGESAGEAFGDAFAAVVREATSDAIGGDDADAAEKGSSAGGAFGAAFRSSVDAAIKDLPNANIDLNSSGFDIQVQQIRAELEELSNQRIGVDISDDDAIAKLAELKAALDEIGASSPSARVSVDTAAASAELGAFEAEVAGATAATDGLDDGAGGAAGGVGSLGASAASSGPEIGLMTAAIAAAIPMLSALGGLAGGALAALPAILGGAAAGIGALKLGLGGISGALSAYSTQQSSAAKTTASTAASESQAAQQALSNAATIRNAANSVAQAEEALSNAQQSAADSVHQANEQVISSENALADAEYNEQQAQEALTQARIDAANQLTDYNDQLADGALGIQQAQIDVQNAQLGIAAVGPGTDSTALQQQQAQLTYEQAVQRLKDLQDQQGQLQQTASAANAAGVDGSQQVVDAQHQLLDATTAVATANQTVSDAQTSQSEAEASAVQKVTDAQNSLTNALLNQQEALQQVALAGASDGGGAGGAAAAPDAFAAAMAKLTPQGQQFVNYLIGLKKQFDDLGNSVQSVLVPGLQVGLEGAMKNFPALSGFIVQAGQDIGDLAAKFGLFLGSAQGQKEVNTIFSAGAGFMKQMGDNALTLFEAFGSIGSKSTPIVKALGDGITHLVDAFAKWAEGGGFQKFLDWLAQNGPDLVSDLGNIIKGIGSFLTDIAPLGVYLLDVAGALGKILQVLSPVIDAISKFVAWINKIQLTAVINAVDFLSQHWHQAWSDIEQWATDAYAHVKSAVFDPLVDFFTQTLPSTLTEVVGWFGALPGRISAALGDLVDTIFGGLKSVGSWLEANIWGPFSTWFTQLPGRISTALGDFFTAAFVTLKSVGTWLETNVAQPTISWFAGLPGRVATALGDFLGGAFASLSLVGFWLETNVWGPISSWFSGLGARIATVAAGMWDGVGNAFIDVINDMINVWDALKFTLPSVSFLGVTIGGNTIGVPQIPDIPPIGGKAGGGPVDAGTPYWVGELGPEIFQPAVSGTIVPNHVATTAAALAGGSSRPVGPVFDRSEMHFHDEADIEGLMRQASFMRKARRF
jgi:hypothetical protein